MNPITNNFEKVTRKEFGDAIKNSKSSDAFEKHMVALQLGLDMEDDFFIHRGSLTLSGNFNVPGFYTLILGDLTVEGLVDLSNPEGFDEGGVFITLGSVICKAFSNEYGKLALIDGNLEARDIIINSYEDAGLFVFGNLKTKFFYGWDVWAEVGGTAEMEYGNGYCLPIGYTDAAGQAINTRHDRKISMSLLIVDESDSKGESKLIALLKEGKSVFK